MQQGRFNNRSVGREARRRRHNPNYSGQSVDLWTRFQSQLDRGPWFGSRAGRFGLDNLPDSLSWQIETYDLADLQAVYPKHWPLEELVNEAETFSICTHERHFNSLTKRRNPDGYSKAARIANAGVLLDAPA